MMKRLAAVGIMSAAFGGALLAAPPALADTTAAHQAKSGVSHYGHHHHKCDKARTLATIYKCELGVYDLRHYIYKEVLGSLKGGHYHAYRYKHHGHHDGHK
uniref:hypothetical protein n=1 Tax=uncultured Thermomonospora sp. TaxID=671175 RepID=UPI00259B4918